MKPSMPWCEHTVPLDSDCPHCAALARERREARVAAPDREAGYLDYDQPPDPPAGLTGALLWGAWCGFVLLLVGNALFGGAA